MTTEVYNSMVARVPSPDGTLFVAIIEDKDGRPWKVEINIGKAGSPLGAWAQATSLMCSKILKDGGTISDLIEILSEITSYRAVTDDRRVTVRSGVEGFVHALFLYRAGKFELLRETLGIPSDADMEDTGPKTSQ